MTTLQYAELLYQLRKGRGLTQGAVAEEAGMALNVYIRYERGFALPPEQTFMRLADALNVTDEEYAALRAALSASQIGPRAYRPSEREQREAAAPRPLAPARDNGHLVTFDARDEPLLRELHELLHSDGTPLRVRERVRDELRRWLTAARRDGLL